MKTFVLAASAALATATHYGDPCSAAGCMTGEQAVDVTGLDGSFCSPDCTKAACPTDKPAGASATPTCALTAASGAKACALVCAAGAAIKDQKVADAACGAGASCKPIQGTGICTYDDCGPSPAPTPPPPPSPPPTPVPPGGAQWYLLPFTRTILFETAAQTADAALFTCAANTAAGSVESGVIKTADGGVSFTDLNVSAGTLLEGIAAHSETSAVAVGLLGAKYTVDGQSFKDSVIEGDLIGGVWGKVRAFGGGAKLKYGIAGAFGPKKGSGVAVSGTDGVLFKTIDAANATGLNATRYPGLSASFVDANTWYVVMGSEPAPPPSQQQQQQSQQGSQEGGFLAAGETVTQRLGPRVFAVRNDSTGAIAPRYRWATAAAADAATADATDDAPPGPDTGLYTAIVKTTDAGATWSVVYTNEGNFLLSGIDCADALHCIAVGSGGSEPPSAEYSVIYATSDGGATWKQTDKQVGGAHCLDVRFVGPSEAWAACYAASDPLHIDGHFKHTTDAGATWYTNELKGAILLGFDMFDAHHGWATVFHYASGACGIAKFSTTAPTPPPTPPPSPPRPGQTHYGDPYVGSCESDEQNVTITGMAGALCAPLCSEPGDGCPSDVPAQVVAVPQCLLSDPDTGVKLCALVCSLGSSGVEADDDQCGPKASCKQPAGSNAGICSYDDLAPPTPPPPTPKPTPPPPPTPPTPRPPGHYDNPYTGACLPDEKNITTRDNSWSTCSPPCTGVLKKRTCPMDGPPSGNSTGGGEIGCALEDDEGTHYCAITCTENKDCPYAASCDIDMVPILGFGLCGYNPPVART